MENDIDGNLIERGTGASFNRGKSKQNYATPQDFRTAVINKFGWPGFDLAADSSNHFANNHWSAPGTAFFDEEKDAFKQDWTALGELLWLNPPFDNIAPWAKKCYEAARSKTKILFLVPASVGSNWFSHYVHNCAMVYFLSPRLCFDGKNPYPKDMLLASYNDLHYVGKCGYECWRWK